MSLGDRAFRERGLLLALLAGGLLLLAHPSHASLRLGGLLALGPLVLRFWAFSHLGGEGRTRDPGAPTERVASGPYRWLAHPVYLANGGLAAGMVIAAGPAPLAGIVALSVASGFYLLLARREGRQLRGVPPRPLRPRAPWAVVARWERSTWLTTGLWFALLWIRSRG